MSAIFGGSKSSQSSSSSNQAYPYIQQQFGGQVRGGLQAGDQIRAILGLGGDSAAASQAFQNYKNSTGYQTNLDAGSRAVTDNAASRGLLGSGSTLQALTNYGTNLNNQYYNNYLQNLLGQQTMGNAAGSLIAGSGQKYSSTGSSSQKPGLGGFIGGVLSGIPGI